ncbi:cytochrome c oxidase assembly protein subunit 11 [Ancylobacter sp. 3268]|uniref:cytochrome c oxidase assembly protein n=1 Tax=Ancylobacter sp. 3268 TaxID=2817752 RepID=UPI0028662EB5|nr:cytochrome c oxidase assembly protein [Ancylobacter sp. 3268]MDR6952808.1 cytochrome c oxidase assembly protein subunit 11 [Ancylobacter sp. 3268]
MSASETPRREPAGAGSPSTPRRHGLVAAGCLAFVAVMVGAAYASVPLYQLFCQVTGFGGTTQVAASAPATTSDREIEIRFDANVAPGLPWRFLPEQRAVTVKLGETKLAYYKVENIGAKPVTATASYNVTPAQAGYHFAKMQCFCFTDQTLQPGEVLDMPVVFFVDPALADDPDATGVKTITLSYTFFAKAKLAEPVAVAPPKPGEESKSPL